jgi:3-dehydroquinate dehydratase type I
MISEEVSSRLCASIGTGSLHQLEKLLKRALHIGAGLVEIRVDYLAEGELAGLRGLVAKHRERLILTCRTRQEGGHFRGDLPEYLRTVQDLMAMEPRFVDLEFYWVKNRLAGLKGQRGIIVSWHDPQRTPLPGQLRRRLEGMKGYGEIVKIVPWARTGRDAANVLGLYRFTRPGELIAFAQGPRGLPSRLLCLFAGAPFTYVSVGEEATAPGQIPLEDAKFLIAAMAPYLSAARAGAPA